MSFVSASGQRITPLGKMALEVETESGVSGNLIAVVIPTTQAVSCFLGRDALDWIFPQCRTTFALYSIESDSVNEIKEKFKRILQVSDTANAIEGFTANLVLKSGVPMFQKAYTVPYSLQKPVVENLEKLVKDRILIPCRSSPRASPVVVVKKKDGSVRWCLDGKATINKMIFYRSLPVTANR